MKDTFSSPRRARQVCRILIDGGRARMKKGRLKDAFSNARQVCRNLLDGGRVAVLPDGTVAAAGPGALEGLQEDGLTPSAALAQGRRVRSLERFACSVELGATEIPAFL